MKGFYVICSPVSEINDSGVWKKIQAQIRALNNAGLDTRLFDCSCSISNIYHKIQRKINPYYFTKNISNDFFCYDFYYFRYCYSTVPFMGLIKKIKQYGKGKIIIEIPTYPYYKEFKSGLPQITLLIDKILSKGLKKHVDRITTYSKHETIFNIPTIQILNGVECSLIPIKTITIRDDKELNLIAVANFYKWHGYERLIEGLHNHYKQELSQKVRLHFVGDGPEFNLYKNLIMQYNLSQYVTFHGILSGEKLTEVFDKVDIAINSLGSHRIGIHLSSALKSREYLARGMPMVSSTKIDILPEGFKYCLYVPEDESPIDIQTMVEFYQSLLAVKSISEVSYEIRRFAENNCDMSITMKPVIDYLSRV